MSDNYDLEFESKLKKIGYKKVWFSDKSGYWMSKTFKSKEVKGLLIDSVVETDTKRWYFDLKNPKANSVAGEDASMYGVVRKYSKTDILKYK